MCENSDVLSFGGQPTVTDLLQSGGPFKLTNPNLDLLHPSA